MKIRFDTLAEHLGKGFGPVYLIFGAEPLLVEETLDEFRSLARKDGVTDRTRHTVEAGFDWDVIFEEGQTLSLFKEKKLIELRMPTGRPGDKGARALVDYAGNPPEDNTLVVIAGNIDRTGQKTKWFQTLEKSATVVQCPAVTPEQLPDWIRKRVASRNLSFEEEAIRRLCQMVEGNLLAAAQEIDLLKLLYRDQTVTLEIVEDLIANHARHDAFMFVDVCLMGYQNRALRMLHNMKRTGVEPLVILWSMAREVRQICRIWEESERQRVSPRSLHQRFGVWRSRQGTIAAAMERLGRAQWENVLILLCYTDHRIKGGIPMARKDVWEELENIALRMCGVAVP
ncbi:MAG: DNA polymerase III subunit delta [Gammaproteobacteria bacterium]|nr:DNA polymerase III subunit delta [Gammaproteobacteria bacterium]MYD77085.1 DNA polymerase III subunit delta [Gammaproteobacteria bacterium]MYJ51483.1 DNA polymerase III subunit delta [Gammaproteobacteria bacterium]